MPAWMYDEQPKHVLSADWGTSGSTAINTAATIAGLSQTPFAVADASTTGTAQIQVNIAESGSSVVACTDQQAKVSIATGHGQAASSTANPGSKKDDDKQATGSKQDDKNKKSGNKKNDDKKDDKKDDNNKCKYIDYY